MNESSDSLRQWTAVDQYLVNQLIPTDPILEAVSKKCVEAELPAIQVTANQGKFLMMLAKIQRASKILEIGSLGGYSTIWLARALPTDGTLISIEFEPKHARIAKENIEYAGLSDRVEIRVGNAVEILPALASERLGPFDMIFVDADKPNNPIYFEWALKLSRPGTLIVVDNVVRDGQITDSNSIDPSVIGTRQFLEKASRELCVTATALQTVGEKGYDGFAMILVQGIAP